MPPVVTDAPKRIQRRRTKGWKMPAGALYVGRGTKWGNPFKVGPDGPVEWVVVLFAVHMWSPQMPLVRAQIRAELRGRDLACWCPLDQPCHADVLLEIANEEPSAADACGRADGAPWDTE